MVSMDGQGDLTVKELANLYPKIRSNIRFTFQIIKNTPGYVVEDPINSRYYRIGVVEYKFVSLLNGKRSVADAIRIVTDSMAEEALDHHEVVQILHWLGTTNLLHTNHEVKEDQFTGLFGLSHGVSKIIFPRIPFGNPDRFLQYILPIFRPVLGLPFLIVWFAVVIFSTYLVLEEWPRFVHTANTIQTLQHGLYLAIIWVLLKVIHELWHGLVCKYHGAEVRETGVLFILLLPLGYVDTSSSWNIPSKWKRIDIALAGMKIEIFIAAVAAIMWSETSAGIVNQLCYEVVLMASITTIIFNANPLMRFDGYYVLADLLEEVNLYSRANHFLKHMAKKYILGVRSCVVENSFATKVLLFIYGVCAFLWRIVIFVGIAIGASFLFLGVGIAFALAYAVAFVVVPSLKVLHYMLIGTKVERPSLLRSLAVIALVVYGGYALFFHATWQRRMEAPGIVEFKNFAICRAYSPGFVEKIHVQTGDYVKKGQVIIELHNPEIMAEYKQLQIEIAQLQVKIRYFNEVDLVAAKIEQEKLDYFKKRAMQHKKLVDAMSVRAAIDGYIATRQVSHLANTFVEVGQELVAIFDPRDVQLLVAISQKDIEQYQVFLERENLNIYISCLQKTYGGKLIVISPQASRTIPHMALAVVGGGEIAVQATEESYQFVVPHFFAEISLNVSDTNDFKYGQRGYVRIYHQEETVGKFIYYELQNWFHEIWKTNK